MAQREYDAIEDKILDREKRLAEEQQALEKRIEQLYSRWEELEAVKER